MTYAPESKLLEALYGLFAHPQPEAEFARTDEARADVEPGPGLLNRILELHDRMMVAPSGESAARHGTPDPRPVPFYREPARATFTAPQVPELNVPSRFMRHGKQAPEPMLGVPAGRDRSVFFDQSERQALPDDPQKVGPANQR